MSFQISPAGLVLTGLGAAPSLSSAWLPGTPLPSCLQKLRSCSGGLLSTDEFQKLFDEFDKRVIKEVTVAGPGAPVVSGEVLGVSWH